MAQRAENEGIRVLGEFVCEAIHAPGMPQAASKQAEEEPVNGRARPAQRVLADAVYRILRTLVPAARAEITYSELVNQLGPLPPPNQDLQPRDARLDFALGELVSACRQRKLPAISALVVREEDRMPGSGYYLVAHPTEASDPVQAIIAWGHEVERVRTTTYPANL